MSKNPPKVWRDCFGCGKRIHVYFGVKRCESCEVACGKVRLIAERVVRKAFKTGDLKPAREFACVDCGHPAHGYDHRDYRKPLEVQPVCSHCNYWRGSAKW